MYAVPKSAKNTDGLTVYFVLLGSAQVKASCKLLVNSTLDLLKQNKQKKSN